jgi:hypothetical protein
MNITTLQLETGEFYAEKTNKQVIVLHHTAGGPSAVNVITGSWEHDKSSTGGKLPVATSYVIGGFIKDDEKMDGLIHKTFDDSMWAHHLGCKTANNTALNKQSIGIEICNFGPLTLNKDGKYITYVGSEIVKENVFKLDKPFRGFTYYHEYTDKQIASLKDLILDIKTRHNINIKKIWNLDSFELSQTALAGAPGIYSYVK